LSGFKCPAAVKERHQHDYEVKTQSGKSKIVRVPILETKNMGEEMAIDETLIGEDFYTILTNRKTGKIALLAQTVRASELSKLIPKFDKKGFQKYNARFIAF
jgi:formylmethanofuran:tetrahydromethanopterin formyltransferase